MPLTPAEVDFVENMAQQQIRYETILIDQTEILKTDQLEFDRARAQIQQSTFVAKPGQRWVPTQDKVDEHLAQCDEICRSVPRDFDELSLLQSS